MLPGDDAGPVGHAHLAGYTAKGRGALGARFGHIHQIIGTQAIGRGRGPTDHTFHPVSVYKVLAGFAAKGHGQALDIGGISAIAGLGARRAWCPL